VDVSSAIRKGSGKWEKGKGKREETSGGSVKT
jgi:hypothetical protein